MMASASAATDPYEAESLYDLVGSMVDDETYVDLFTREQIPIQNYFACILSRAHRMSPALRVRLEEMFKFLVCSGRSSPHLLTTRCANYFTRSSSEIAFQLDACLVVVLLFPVETHQTRAGFGSRKAN